MDPGWSAECPWLLRTGQAAAAALLEQAPVADPEDARRQQALQIQQILTGQ